jgi:hypothetical protein
MPNIVLLLKDQTHAAKKPPTQKPVVCVLRAVWLVRFRATSLLSVRTLLRRLTQTPWMADPFLKETILLCQGMMKAISYSEDLQRRFNANVQHVEESPFNAGRIRSLRFAKQRFDSGSRPLGRLILLFDAVWATAVETLLIRQTTNASYEKCFAFLENMTEERLLQAALVADAADLCMGFLRCLDTEQSDPAELTGQLEQLVHDTDALFVQGGALTAPESFTVFTIQMLRRPRSCHLQATLKTLGGPER